ncbi:hypothetical protein MSAN_01739800 [Mycena sanguinolenta]|uniref:Uncharacterized protein n=1 Tax=Mycena sanguinolenta TaxID=230812 RepID=A0A8H7CTB9_9AGAR|nr:hypothetical protein MSAN_01739800 [Mycena sanguinolenta]
MVSAQDVYAHSIHNIFSVQHLLVPASSALASAFSHTQRRLRASRTTKMHYESVLCRGMTRTMWTRKSASRIARSRDRIVVLMLIFSPISYSFRTFAHYSSLPLVFLGPVRLPGPKLIIDFVRYIEHHWMFIILVLGLAWPLILEDLRWI